MGGRCCNGGPHPAAAGRAHGGQPAAQRPRGVQYLAAWLAGSGSVPLYNLMEDAATAEISRVQNWQWLRHGAALDAGGVEVRATPELLARVMEEEMARIQAEVGPERFRQGRYAEARRILQPAVHGAGARRLPDAGRVQPHRGAPSRRCVAVQALSVVGIVVAFE